MLVYQGVKAQCIATIHLESHLLACNNPILGILWMVNPQNFAGWWFQPLWKKWKSVGINIWENNIHVPNHQPGWYLNHHFSWFFCCPANFYQVAVSPSVVSLAPPAPPAATPAEAPGARRRVGGAGADGSCCGVGNHPGGRPNDPSLKRKPGSLVFFFLEWSSSKIIWV